MKERCSVPQCTLPRRARGLCQPHYLRQWRAERRQPERRGYTGESTYLSGGADWWRLTCLLCDVQWAVPAYGAEGRGDTTCARCPSAPSMLARPSGPPLHLHRATSLEVGPLACWPGEECPL